jgi:FAD:protein FMN transferase
MNRKSLDGARRNWLRASLGMAGASAVGVSAFGVCATASLANAALANTPLLWQERALLGFGTTLSLRAAHRDARVLSQALDDAIAEIRTVERLMSLFDPDSAVSRLNVDGLLHQPDARLLEVLALARRVAQRSDGAFDVTMQPFWQLWQSASKQGRFPTSSELTQARAKVDWRKLRFDVNAVRFAAPGMAISLNGIAQGYAADRARAALQKHGVANALLDTGEWAPMGRADAATPWQLGIADPHHRDALIATLATDGRCVATSSDDRTVFSADRVHHHIVDPRCGQSPLLLSSVTVAAPSGALADALTKVFFMAETGLGTLPYESTTTHEARHATKHKFNPRLAQVASAIAASWQVDALLVDKQGAWWASPGLLLKQG